MELRPGDLVEVVNTPPPGWVFDGAGPVSLAIGDQGVVVSGAYLPMDRRYGFPIVDVRFPQGVVDIACPLLRKLAGPPEEAQEREHEKTFSVW